MEVEELFFARKLKEVRTRRGLNQKELAEKLGIDPNRISNWELGYHLPPLNVFRKLCVVLGVAPGELLNLVIADLTPEERELIQAYRTIDDDGRHTVDAVVASQLMRVKK